MITSSLTLYFSRIFHQDSTAFFVTFFKCTNDRLLDINDKEVASTTIVYPFYHYVLGLSEPSIIRIVAFGDRIIPIRKLIALEPGQHKDLFIKGKQEMNYG